MELAVFQEANHFSLQAWELCADAKLFGYVLGGWVKDLDRADVICHSRYLLIEG
jgi:hypothetical protein